MMTKPVPLLVQVCADQFTLRRLGRITQASLTESHPHGVQMTVEAPNYSGS